MFIFYIINKELLYHTTSRYLLVQQTSLLSREKSSFRFLFYYTQHLYWNPAPKSFSRYPRRNLLHFLHQMRQKRKTGNVFRLRSNNNKQAICKKFPYSHIARHCNLIGHNLDNIKYLHVDIGFCSVHTERKQEIKWVHKVHTQKKWNS